MTKTVSVWLTWRHRGHPSWICSPWRCDKEPVALFRLEREQVTTGRPAEWQGVGGPHAAIVAVSFHRWQREPHGTETGCSTIVRTPFAPADKGPESLNRLIACGSSGQMQTAVTARTKTIYNDHNQSDWPHGSSVHTSHNVCSSPAPTASPMTLEVVIKMHFFLTHVFSG